MNSKNKPEVIQVAEIQNEASIKDIFVHEDFIIAHLANKQVLLYKAREDGDTLEEFENSRIVLDFDNDAYAFDVKYSDLKMLDNSTGVSVLISPNLSKKNVLKHYDITKGTNAAGETIYNQTFVMDHQLDSTRMNTFALSEDYLAIGCEQCNSFLGLIDIYSFSVEADFPTVFTKKGSTKKEKNFYFGAQTEMYQKGNMTFVYITSQ